MNARERPTPARGLRRAALVAVAAELFARNPYDDIYTSDIAEAAGVAHGLLFYHFKDKRGLYLAVLEKLLQEILDLHRPRQRESTKEDRLRGLLRRQIQYRRNNVYTMLALMRAGGQDPELDKIWERGRRGGADFVLELLDLDGEPPPPLRVAIRGIMGMFDEATADWFAHDCDLGDAEFEQVVYAAAVAVLATVQSVHEDVRAAVIELTLPA
jgi:AcrR family transcriptional regulator